MLVVPIEATSVMLITCNEPITYECSVGRAQQIDELRVSC